MSDTTAVATLETPADAGKGGAGLVTYYLDALDVSDKSEREWRKRAAEVVKDYRDDGCLNASMADGSLHGLKKFNILYSNTETIAPALYNSTPVPDVRRRFRDDDPVGKVAAQLLERCLIYTLDVCGFDQPMEAAVKDALLPGRAVTRIRYEPTIEGDGAQAQIVDEKVSVETVAWDRFRRGPGRFWREVPWEAFEHFLSREELVKINARIGATMDLDCVVGDRPEDAKPDGDLLKRARVWEIWDRERKKVVFVAPSYRDGPLADLDDPLGLTDFFCTPRPIYALETPGSLVPVEPYRLYRRLAEELEHVTVRISALVEVMKFRGVYNDLGAGEVMTVIEALEDGQFGPIQSPMAADGGIKNAFFVMPIDMLVPVLAQLYAARDQIKQTIYEVTGISDIVRGASTASETATAQQIKAQWGSLRVQKLQKEVQRYARDILRLVAEVIAEKFQPATMLAMSGLQIPTEAQVQQAAMMGHNGGPPMGADPGQPSQTPAAPEPPPVTLEAVVALLRDDKLRSYRVDIETDSTIRADLTRDQQNVSQFVQGFGGFIQAVGPAVQSGYLTAGDAGKMLKSFSRVFKLGREVEDMLDELGSREAPPPAADGQAEAQAAAQAEAAQAQADAELQGRIAQAEIGAKAQIETAKAQAQQQIEADKLAANERIEQMKFENALAIERLKQEGEIERERMRLEAEGYRNTETLAAQQREPADAPAPTQPAPSSEPVVINLAVDARPAASRGSRTVSVRRGADGSLVGEIADPESPEA